MRTIEDVVELHAKSQFVSVFRAHAEALVRGKILGGKAGIANASLEVLAVPQFSCCSVGIGEARCIDIRLPNSFVACREIATWSDIDIDRLKAGVAIGRVQRYRSSGVVVEVEVRAPASYYRIQQSTRTSQELLPATERKVIDDVTFHDMGLVEVQDVFALVLQVIDVLQRACIVQLFKVRIHISMSAGPTITALS